MKKINILLFMFVGLMLIVASCDSDRDSNPTIQQPESFVLNTPPYAANTVNLISSTTLELTTTQPDYGFPAAVVYSVQVSLNDTWEEGTEEIAPTYYTLETTYTTARLNAVASEMAKAVVQLSGWTEESQVPTEAMKIYVRLKGHLESGLYPVYSNSVEITVLPYFILLKDADPAPYYLIGAPIGDGKWTNEPGAIGVSIIPMALVEDFEYDKTTGKGQFVYTGYFPADQGFKIIGVPGSWDEQWGNGDAKGIDNPVHNDGGSNDFVVPADGWYKITLNSIANTLKFESVSAPGAPHATMELVGDFEGWGGAPVMMTRVGGENSHVWYAEFTLDADGGCKFRTDDTWGNNWGGSTFPYGVATSNNIPAVAGTYKVILNDLDRCYYFIDQAE